VLGLPLTRTVDGFEAHIGTNHLGHFALTCRLGDKITDRVISVGSAMYIIGRLRLDDLNWQRRKYSVFAAYAQSKLATMLFTDELARRGVRAYISDPGMAYTDITRDSSGLLYWLGEHLLEHLAQSATDCARATIEALTTDLPSGTYLAPRFNQWGKPKVTAPARKARDPETARRLWELSADLTGCDWVGRPT
jgi:NAD(P)-dependent dehydrogenase (short-subunit alcohol dehydrogenase family)